MAVCTKAVYAEFCRRLL